MVSAGNGVSRQWCQHIVVSLAGDVIDWWRWHIMLTASDAVSSQCCQQTPPQLDTQRVATPYSQVVPSTIIQQCHKKTRTGAPLTPFEPQFTDFPRFLAQLRLTTR